jgi:hypothetical protein
MNNWELEEELSDPDFYFDSYDIIKGKVCFGIRAMTRRNTEFLIETDVILNVRNAIREFMQSELEE